MLYLQDQGHNPGGVHAFYRSLKTFLFWYEREEPFPDEINPIRNVKPPRVAVQPLEPVEIASVKKLLAVCNDKSFMSLRDKSILLLLLDTGLRASELCALDVEDVDPVTGELVVRHGKGDKSRAGILGRKSRRALRNYLNVRNDDNDALYLSRRHTRLTYWGLNQMLKRRSKQAGIEPVQLHSFRRAFALNCLRNGMDIYSLQRLMGHADLQVMRRYLAQTDDDLRIAHAKASPVDGWRL